MEYLSALVAPFFLLLVENYLPYPYVIEEIVKFFLAKYSQTTKTAIMLGILFSFSEAIFYFMNPSYSFIFDLKKSVVRLLIVTPMHISTILIMRYFIRRKSLWPFGLIAAILLHYLFNNINL